MLDICNHLCYSSVQIEHLHYIVVYRALKEEKSSLHWILSKVLSDRLIGNIM